MAFYYNIMKQAATLRKNGYLEIGLPEFEVLALPFFDCVILNKFTLLASIFMSTQWILKMPILKLCDDHNGEAN